MNCKKGEMAFIIKVSPGHEELLNQIVTTITTDNHWTRAAGIPFWTVDMKFRGEQLYVRDDCLRPLRNPGSDEVDESARWLPPVPKSEEITA